MTAADIGDYRAAMDWLHARRGRGIDFGLDRIGDLLHALGDPHLSFRTVHVAGTNGKGSVATMVARVLESAGQRTGLYTSPHLVRFTERIQVDAVEISRVELTRVLDRISDAAAAFPAGDDLTFFEICTAAAFLHFADREVEWAVVETGMGGRLDATNVIHGDIAVITNVSLDHTDYLGDTIEAIAAEKAGIVEPGAPLVTGATGSALDVLTSHVDGEVVVARPDEDDGPLAAAGDHQRENAAVVRATAVVLRGEGVPISNDTVDEVLATTVLPGRLETFDHRQALVTIDSAHNVAGAEAVARHLDDGSDHDMIVGFNQDKDWDTMLTHLLPIAVRVRVVPIRSPRSADPEAVAALVRARSDVDVAVSPTVATALEDLVSSGSDSVLVVGSGTLAGEARAVLTGQPLDEVDGSR